MPLNFPSSPTANQIYTDSTSGNRYLWNSTSNVWLWTPNNISMTVQAAAPGTPSAGSLWWNSEYGRMFVYYNDGDSSQWVEASPIPDSAVLANIANSAANTKLANTSGVTFAGNLFFPQGSTLGIGSSDAVAPLTVSLNNTVSISLAGVIIDTDGSSNTFLQNHIRNANTGINASSDWVATADDGSDTTNFIDLGINNSGFSSPTWTINGKRDGYLYTVDSNLSIGSANSTSRTKYVNFFVGGTLSSNEAMRIQDSSVGPNVGIGTVSPSSKLEVSGAIKDSKGDIRDVPLNPQTATYSLTLGDTGKIIQANSGVLVPNAVFSTGQAVTVYNNTATSITITSNSSVTMFLAGTSNTSVRNLAQRGLATIVCVLANTFVISGSGLS